MWYPHHIADWISKWFSSYTWHGDRNKPIVHLTFDDGPTPEVTDSVLEQLEQFGMKATFFCIGDCVQKYPKIYNRIITSGHAVGNHTMYHINGWQVRNSQYLEDIQQAEYFIDSKLFRPPYGKITPIATSLIKNKGYQIIQWDVISGDFDERKSAEDCLIALKKYTRKGSIIVFHDSLKAWPRLKEILPKYLEYLTDKNWTSVPIENIAVTK